MQKPTKIILGSQSPRRFEILSDAGFDIEIVRPKVVEHFPYTMDFYQVPEYLSKLKMHDVYSYVGEDQHFIICADTVVIHDKKLVGKPKNKDIAFKYLKSMNGKVHDVITGVSIRKNKKQLSFSEHTKVHFKELKDDEIWHYVEKFETLDKAGAYNIQEYVGVEKIEGEFFNVMGLPLKRVLQEIKGWK
ncbi:MAG TPA: Maf family nucleotide pyrophosphatase [Chitinophagales bacterium]|jgi:septum formation protein|nr:Maf family nucleotide pyrophosphatase [Chitinophagales bacterium]